jgi:hypothetical protein
VLLRQGEGQKGRKRLGHLNEDSTYGSNKRPRLLPSTGEFDELESNEDITLCPEESEAASWEGAERGSLDDGEQDDGEQNDSESESDDQ